MNETREETHRNLATRRAGMYAVTGLLNVLDLVEREADLIAEMLEESQPSHLDASDIIDWGQLIRQVAACAGRAAGLSMGALNEKVNFSVRGFLALVGLYPIVHPDDTSIVTKTKWIAQGLSLGDYAVVIEMYGNRVVISE